MTPAGDGKATSSPLSQSKKASEKNDASSPSDQQVRQTGNGNGDGESMTPAGDSGQNHVQAETTGTVPMVHILSDFFLTTH